MKTDCRVRGCYHVWRRSTTVIVGIATPPPSVDSLSRGSRGKLRGIHRFCQADPATASRMSADKLVNAEQSIHPLYLCVVDKFEGLILVNAATLHGSPAGSTEAGSR